MPTFAPTLARVLFSISLTTLPVAALEASGPEWVGATQAWDEPANWEPAGMPATDADVTFNDKGETTVATNRSNRQVNSLTFGDKANAYTFVGGNFILANTVATTEESASQQDLSGIVLKAGKMLQIVHHGAAALVLGDIKNTAKTPDSCELAISGDGDGTFGSFLVEGATPFLVLAGTGTWKGSGSVDFRINEGDGTEYAHSEIMVMDGTLDVTDMTLNIKADAAPTEEEYLVIDYSIQKGVLTPNKNTGYFFKAVTGLPAGYELKHKAEEKQVVLVKK